jgi:hypothetical protein
MINGMIKIAVFQAILNVELVYDLASGNLSFKLGSLLVSEC